MSVFSIIKPTVFSEINLFLLRVSRWLNAVKFRTGPETGPWAQSAQEQIWIGPRRKWWGIRSSIFRSKWAIGPLLFLEKARNAVWGIFLLGQIWTWPELFSSERNMQSCVCFWKVRGEQDCWDKDIVSFILERMREREIHKWRYRSKEKITEKKETC